MCIRIDSKCVLLNVLSVLESADPEALHNFALELKHSVPQAYIDISDASVSTAVETNSCFLSLDGDRVRRAPGFPFVSKRFLNKTVNLALPKDVRAAIRQAAAAISTKDMRGTGCGYADQGVP